MKYLIISFIIFLSGCYQTVNRFDMDRAAKVCAGRENIVEIYAAFNGGEIVLCSDGSEYRLNQQ